jgi:hypothetical protein
MGQLLPPSGVGQLLHPGGAGQLPHGRAGQLLPPCGYSQCPAPDCDWNCEVLGSGLVLDCLECRLISRSVTGGRSLKSHFRGRLANNVGILSSWADNDRDRRPRTMEGAGKKWTTTSPCPPPGRDHHADSPDEVGGHHHSWFVEADRTPRNGVVKDHPQDGPGGWHCLQRQPPPPPPLAPPENTRGGTDSFERTGAAVPLSLPLPAPPAAPERSQQLLFSTAQLLGVDLVSMEINISI